MADNPFEQPAQQPPQQPPAQPDTKNATVSLITGILSLIIPFIGLILGIVAIVFYTKQKKIAPNGMATAGLICGIIGLVGNLLLIGLFTIALLAQGGIMGPDRFMPDRCTTSPPFSCNEYRVTQGQAMVRLQNNGGIDLNSVAVTLTCPDGRTVRSAEGPVTIANGDSAMFRFSGCTTSASQFQGQFEISYVQAGSAVAQRSGGSLTARVE